MITLTESAASEVRRLMAETGQAAGHLRIGIKSGGCSGFSYELGFEDAGGLGDGDQRFESQGVPVVVDMKSYFYIMGLVIDFEQKLLGGGFRFENPNATGGCGCGTSFSA
jgi:iron-sulfur cluster assembly protein